MTKPSRSLSQGRLAPSGSALRVDSARAAAKPPIASGQMVDSAPPAIITSASPYSIMRPGLADRMGAGGAGGHHRHVGPLQAEHDRQMPGNHVDDGCRNEERRNLARSIGEKGLVRFLDHLQTADAGTDIDADPLAIGFGHFQTGILERIDGRRQTEMNEGIHPARILGAQVFRQFEILYITGDLAGKRRRIEAIDASDTGFASHQTGPCVIHAIADG
jgi:hypothetical protein